MLFVSFEWHELIVEEDLHSRHRAGSANATYDWWCEEAVPVPSVMPSDSREFNGISIVDATDPRRYHIAIIPATSLSASDPNLSGISDSVGSCGHSASGTTLFDGGRVDWGALAWRADKK